MTDPRLKLTLVGIQPPANNEAPIPLNRYEARHEYTPSGARPSCWNDYQPTPVYIAPTVSRRSQAPTVMLPRPPRPVPAATPIPLATRSPVWPQVVAGFVVCYIVGLIMICAAMATGWH